MGKTLHRILIETRQCVSVWTIKIREDDDKITQENWQDDASPKRSEIWQNGIIWKSS